MDIHRQGGRTTIRTTDVTYVIEGTELLETIVHRTPPRDVLSAQDLDRLLSALERGELSPAPGPATSSKASLNPQNTLYGLACSEGEIEGLVGANEILVAKDLPLRSALDLKGVKGLIIERGNLLSHAATLARELKIPCVIGVQSATRLFTTGSRVRLNGTTGTIQLL